MSLATDFLKWEFQQNFLMSPQQMTSRFAQYAGQVQFGGAQDFVNEWKQQDGIIWDPESQQAMYAETPMLDRTTSRIGFRRKAYLNSYAIATEEFHKLTAEFRGKISNDFARGWARFRDKILLHEADGMRYVANTTNSTTVSKEIFPAENRRIAKTATNALTNLNLDLLHDMNVTFKNNEVEEGGMPMCIGSPDQIQGLLKITQVQNVDYNTVKTLARGEIDSFYGFKFVMSKAAGKTTTAETGASFHTNSVNSIVENFSDIYGKTTTAEGAGAVKTSATTGYTKITEEAEKMVFCEPMKAFHTGPIEKAGWSNVWMNPSRMGVLEYFFKDSLGFRRTQNPYVYVAYVKNGVDSGVPITTAPIAHTAYNANAKGSTYTWAYSKRQS